MAGKKKSKAKAKNVDHTKGEGNKEQEVLVDAPDEEAEAAPPAAIAEEPVYKCVDKGRVTYLTKSQYDAKQAKN